MLAWTMRFDYIAPRLSFQGADAVGEDGQILAWRANGSPDSGTLVLSGYGDACSLACLQT